MKTSYLAILALALAGTFAVAAQPAGKKADTLPRLKVKPPAADAEEPAADEDDAQETEKKPAKTPAKPGTGLKLSNAGKPAADEDEIIKNLSYMQGLQFGTSIAQFEELGIKLDMDVLMQALHAAAEGKESAMSEEDSQKAAAEINDYVQAKFAAKNKREGEKFLAENKTKKGVKTLPSGLQYKVIESGKGQSPKKTDTVRAHYKGTLLNGMEFDSSYRRGQPASFPVSQVIKGWTEALQLMKVGDKWQLFIPSNLAYEEEGMRNRQGQVIIPPNAALLFEVELLGIEKGSKGPALK